MTRQRWCAALALSVLATVACGGDSKDDDDGSAGRSTTAGSSSTAGASNGGRIGGGITPAGSSAGGASSGGASGAAPSAGGVGQPCTGDAVTCLDADRRRACVDGFYEEDSCASLCSEVGFGVGSCDQGCGCDQPVNMVCDLGAAGFCACYELESGTACTGNEALLAYSACHLELEGAEQIGCYADFVNEAALTVDCAGAATACAAPAP